MTEDRMPAAWGGVHPNLDDMTETQIAIFTLLYRKY